MALLTPTQIARLFVRPTNILTCTILGSSRFSNKWHRWGTYCERVPISGYTASLSPESSTVGHTATGVAKAGGITPTTSPLIGGTQNWFGWHSLEVEFHGEVEPGTTIHANRIGTATFDGSQMPLLWKRMQGYAAKARIVAYRHAAGLDVGELLGPRFYLYQGYKAASGNTWGAPNYAGDYFTDTAGTGYLVNELDIHDTEEWAVGFALRLATDVGAVCAPEGQILAVDAAVFEVQRPGVVWIGEATGGSGVQRYVRDDIYPETIFTDLWPLKGDNRAMFIEVNGTDLTHEQLAEYTAECVRRFRAGTPDGPVILCTGYGNEFENDYVSTRAEWLAWVPAIAESIGGCLLLDTNTALGPFAVNLAEGRYDGSDHVHFGEKGDSDLFKMIGDMIFDAAGLGVSNVIHSDTHRTRDAEGVISDVDAGAGAGKLVIRDSAVVVATITLDDPCGAEAGGVVTFAGFPKTDIACDNGGTPDNAVITDSDDNVVLTLTAGISGTEVLLAKATYAAGEPLKINSATYTAPV